MTLTAVLFWTNTFYHYYLERNSYFFKKIDENTENLSVEKAEKLEHR
jgi:hypothetical protein